MDIPSLFIEARSFRERAKFAAVERILSQIQLDLLETPKQQIDYYFLLGEAQVKLGNYEQSRVALEKALALIQKHHPQDAEHRELTRHYLAHAYYRSHNIQQAQKLHLQCYKAILNKEIWEADLLCQIYYDLGNEYAQLRDYTRAQEMLEAAREQAEQAEYDLEPGLDKIYWALGFAYGVEKKDRQAKISFYKSVAWLEKKADKAGLASVKSNLGKLLIDGNDYYEAETVLKSAIVYGQEISDWRVLASCNINLAYLYLETGRAELALQHALKGIEFSEKCGDNLQLTQAYLQAALIEQAEENKSAAEGYYRQAVKIAGTISSRAITRQLYRAAADFFNEIGDRETAFDMLKKSLDE